MLTVLISDTDWDIGSRQFMGEKIALPIRTKHRKYMTLADRFMASLVFISSILCGFFFWQSILCSQPLNICQWVAEALVHPMNNLPWSNAHLTRQYYTFHASGLPTFQHLSSRASSVIKHHQGQSIRCCVCLFVSLTQCFHVKQLWRRVFYTEVTEGLCFCSACSDHVIRSLNRPLPNNQNIQLVIFASLVINCRCALSFDWVFNVMSSSVVYEEVCCILYGHPSSLSRLDSKAFKLSPT